MSNEIEIVESPETPTAIVWGESVPHSQITTFYDHAFAAVFASLQKAGLRPTGPAYALYTAMGEGEDPHFDLEVGVPVDRAVDGSIEVPEHETVFGSELPACTAAKYRYIGPYEGLGQAWEEFKAGMTQRGLSAGQPCWEVYVTEPSPEADPAAMITDLYWALN